MIKVLFKYVISTYLSSYVEIEEEHN
jgi:hypothetical protein